MTSLDWSDFNMHPELGKPENQKLESYDSELTHPEREPPQVFQAETNLERIQAVDDFIFKVASITEGEYGDWMRRATIYWWSLVDAIYATSNEKIKATLNEMNRIIEFNPNFLILETSRQVLAKAFMIRRELGAPLSPDETPVSHVEHTGESPVPEYSLRLKNPVPPRVEAVISGSDSLGFLGK